MPEFCPIDDMRRDEHSLPAAHLLYLVELVKRWHVTPEAMLAGSGLDDATLKDPQTRVPIALVVELLERARLLTGVPALGMYLGMQMHVSAHGYLGFAAMTAATMREGIDLAVRYVPIVTTALGLRLRIEGREASLIVEEHADFGSARDIVLLSLLIGIWRAGEALTGREIPGFVELAIPHVGSTEQLTYLGPRVRLGQPSSRLVFDALVLSLPYKMADPVALQLAREQCERLLGSLGLDGRVAARVSGLFANGKMELHSLDRVAAALHVSPRTLKRQLAAEGVSFSMLIEKEQRERAILLLRMPSLSIKDVAERLGYSNVANFSRAFQRWTGTTPGEHRLAAAGLARK
jgi:AraC-like DNA-binding protein